MSNPTNTFNNLNETLCAHNIADLLFEIAADKKAAGNANSESAIALKEVCRSAELTLHTFLNLYVELDDFTAMAWCKSLMAAATGFVVSVERKYDNQRNMAVERGLEEPVFEEMGRLLYGEYVDRFTDLQSEGRLEELSKGYTLAEFKAGLDALYIEMNQLFIISETTMFGWRDTSIQGLPWSFTIINNEYIELFSYEEAYSEAAKRAEELKAERADAAKKAKSLALAKIAAMRKKAS